MISILNAELTNYNQKYSTTFSPSPLYSLYPKDESEYGFFQEWPNGNKAGVYVLFDAHMEIIYIGVASNLGSRLHSHFHGTNGKCKPTETWTFEPLYLITLAAPDDAKWERLSLEGYLINKFNPIENTRMKNEV